MQPMDANSSVTDRSRQHADSPTGVQRAIAVLMAVAVDWAVWERRGAALGVVATVFFVGGSVWWVASPSRAMAWSRRHPALDALAAAPLMFFALAIFTTMPLLACAAGGVVAGAALAGVRAILDRRRGFGTS